MKIANLTAAAIGASIVTVVFFSTQYFQSVNNHTALWTGIAFLPMGITSLVVSSYLTDRLVSRYGIRPILAGGMGLIAVGAGSLSLLPINGGYWLAFFPSFTVIGIGFGLAFPGSTMGAVADVETARHGLASGLQQTSFEIGSGSGLAIYLTIAVALTDFGGGDSVSEAAALVSGFHTATSAAAIVAGTTALAALTLRSGIGAESATTEPTADRQIDMTETTD